MVKSTAVTPFQASRRSCRMMRNRPSSSFCSISVISRWMVAEDFARAPQQHLQNGKDQRRVQFQHAVAVVGAQPQRDHAGGRRQAVQKLGVGELLDAHQVDRQVGPQIGRKAGDQVAHEGVVQQVDGADLRLGDAVRPAEIELDGGGFALPVLHVLKDRVDFLLRKLPAQFWAPGQSIGSSPQNFRLSSRNRLHPNLPAALFIRLMKTGFAPMNGV